jgi:hypothetical protein
VADEKTLKIVAKVDGRDASDMSDKEIKEQEALLDAAYKRWIQEKNTMLKGLEPLQKLELGDPSDDERSRAEFDKLRQEAEKWAALQSEAIEEETEQLDKFGVAIKYLTKTVTALDGVNGRMTKVLALIHRSYEGIHKALSKNKQVTDEVSDEAKAVLKSYQEAEAAYKESAYLYGAASDEAQEAGGKLFEAGIAAEKAGIDLNATAKSADLTAIILSKLGKLL